MEKVIDNVWIGDLLDARALEEEDIELDRVVALSSNHTSATTHHYSIRDGECDYDKFVDAVDCVIEGIESDDVMLVHCAAGQSRAPSVLATALVATDEYESFNKALSAIESVRPIVNPLPPLRDRGEYYILSDGPEKQVVEFKDWVMNQ